MNENNTHPLTEARAAEIWGDHAPAYLGQWRSMSDDRRAHAVHLLRVANNAGREHEHERADPHHDPRPWQDCTIKDIREGDLLAARRGDTLIVGVAHHQDEHGDWNTEGNYLLTYGDRWPIRRIPAPTPPAEEVELPDEFGAVIRDVKGDFNEHIRFDRMIWTGCCWTFWNYSTTSEFIHAFTLPDGTRARRDGDRPDGTPRFVKEDT